MQGINYLSYRVRQIFTFIILPALLALSVFAASSSNPAFAETAPRIVVLGDSLAAGYQLPSGASFPDRLQLALDNKNTPAVIIGAGVSGDTSSGGLARLAWSVPDDANAVILELGANDALRGLPPKATAENLEKMIQQLTDRKIKVLLVGMLAPPNMGEDYAAAFNPIYKSLADKYDLPLYPFFLDGVMTVPGMTLADGMHPNEQGVEVMVKGILPLVEDLIKSL